MKKIMLMEPNPYHNEVMMGIVKYFEDLNYIVDVYIREEVIGQDSFCRYKIKGNITGYKIKEIPEIFQSDKMKEYDYLFLSSMEHGENGVLTRFLDENKIEPKTKYGVLGMYHTNSHIERFHDQQMQQDHRLFFISNFQTRKYENVGALAPIYFGENQKKYRKNHDKNKMLIIGATENMRMLQEAYWRLSSVERHALEIRCVRQKPHDSLKRKIHRRIKNFLGLFAPELRTVHDIVYLGRLDFEEMYAEIEQADFMLVLLNPDTDEHKHYKVASTSGIRQLILGFSKVSIICNQLADIYDLNGTSIEFEIGKLHEALKKAIYMTQKEYKEMVQAVSDRADEIYKESLKNLEKTLSIMERGTSK